jgi:hypothetical protein
VIVPELVRPVSPVKVPAIVELPVTAKPPALTVNPPVVTVMPPLLTVRALAAVMAPVFVTFSLLVPLTWKLRKSAVEPAPAAGSFSPIYVPPLAALLPPAIGLPSWKSELVAEAAGVPVKARPVVFAVLVIRPLKVGLLMISTVSVSVLLPTVVRLPLPPARIDNVSPLAIVWFVPLEPATVKIVPLMSPANSELSTNRCWRSLYRLGQWHWS